MDDLIDTPALVIDEVAVHKNIKAYQAYCDKVGLKLRPHIKTHKTKRFMQQQLRAGANGITCQKVGEAEVMADGGADDILITYNIIGASKLRRLKALAQRISKLTVVIDNTVSLHGLAQTFSEETPLHVMVECDTGAQRCGVVTPEEALDLAIQICDLQGLRFAGLMTYPKNGAAQAAATFMRSTVQLLTNAGIECPEVSTGGTPDMWSAGTESVFTEYRIGTYIYNDRSLLVTKVTSEEKCAARVHATVVSRPTDDRLVIDAGSKVLTSDLMGMFSDYGFIVGHPHASIKSMSEEHGVVSVSVDCTLTVGDIIEIIPNHVCVVSNMFNSAWIRTEDNQLINQPIDARGLVN
ncbi:MAG: D-serine deaminase-like pyridoxal phosphate-dependent protein [bacterium]|jgi:D-serine deaminase-like pyridoxal phosphate-dependent protein